VEATQAHYRRCAAYNTQINDVLLTALVQALPNGQVIAPPQWIWATDKEIFDDVDVIRTVGLLTCFGTPREVSHPGDA